MSSPIITEYSGMATVAKEPFRTLGQTVGKSANASL